MAFSLEPHGRRPGTRRSDRDLVADRGGGALRRGGRRRTARRSVDEPARGVRAAAAADLLERAAAFRSSDGTVDAARGLDGRRQRLRRPRRGRRIAATTGPAPTVGPRLLRPEELPPERRRRAGAKPKRTRRKKRTMKRKALVLLGFAIGHRRRQRALPALVREAARPRRRLLRRRLDGLVRRRLAGGRASCCRSRGDVLAAARR